MYNKKEFINNKPKIARNNKEIMILLPSESIYFASSVLTGNAFKVYVILAGQKDGFSLSVNQLTERTGIDKRGIYRTYDELQAKCFIKHNKYKTIEVLYPIEDSSQNGNVSKMDTITNDNDSSQNVHNGENGYYDSSQNGYNVVTKMDTIDSVQNVQHNKYINNIINNNIYAETSKEVSAYNNNFINSDSELKLFMKQVEKDLSNMTDKPIVKRNNIVVDVKKDKSLDDLLFVYNACKNSDEPELDKFNYSLEEKRIFIRLYTEEDINESYYKQYLELYKQNNI